MIHVEDHTLCFPFWQEISPFWQEDVCKEQTTLAAKDSWFIENPFHSCFTVWWDSCLIAYGVVWLKLLLVPLQNQTRKQNKTYKTIATLRASQRIRVELQGRFQAESGLAIWTSWYLQSHCRSQDWEGTHHSTATNLCKQHRNFAHT